MENKKLNALLIKQNSLKKILSVTRSKLAIIAEIQLRVFCMKGLTIISRNGNEKTLSYQIHAMTIARPRPSPLNNNPALSARNRNFRPQSDKRGENKKNHVEKQTKNSIFGFNLTCAI